jgi:hypothetical protein
MQHTEQLPQVYILAHVICIKRCPLAIECNKCGSRFSRIPHKLIFYNRGTPTSTILSYECVYLSCAVAMELKVFGIIYRERLCPQTPIFAQYPTFNHEHHRKTKLILQENNAKRKILNKNTIKCNQRN